MSSELRKKRGVIYVRVSKEEQKKKGYSLPSQLRILKERMEKDGVEEVYPPITEAESARGFGRKGIGELIRLADGGRIDLVYVHRLDRLGRNVAETPFFMYKLNELGITVRTPEKLYKIENPMDFLWAVFESCQADMEGRNIGERTQRGKVEKFLQGKWVGLMKFGYNKVGEVLVKNPELEPVIGEIFKTYAELGDVKATTERCNEYFDERFGKLSVSQVRRILSDPVYMGKPRYGKVSTNAPQLVMVSPEQFELVQTMLRQKASKHKVKQLRKPKSILDEWTKKFGADYVARVLDILIPICPKCRVITDDNGHKIITGPIMVGFGSKIVDCVRLPRFRCPVCGHQQTVPLGSQLGCFQGADLFICPNSKCRAVENFNIRQMVDGIYEYMCRDCGFTFRTSTHPDKALRELQEPEPKKPREGRRRLSRKKKPVKRKTKHGQSIESAEVGKLKTLDKFG